MTDKSRKEAMLTGSQRGFLRGEKEYTGENAKQQRYQMRERIRRRAQDSIRDMSLLIEHLEPWEIEKMFSPEEYREDRSSEDTLYGGMIDTLALLFVSFYDRGLDRPNGDRTNTAPHHVDRLVEAGLRRALGQRGMDIHQYQPVEYETEPFEIEELVERFNQGEAIRLEEFETLQAEGSMTDLRDHVRVRRVEALMPGAALIGENEEGEKVTKIDHGDVVSDPQNEKKDSSESDEE